jgi:hypothetical protein
MSKIKKLCNPKYKTPSPKPFTTDKTYLLLELWEI